MSTSSRRNFLSQSRLAAAGAWAVAAAAPTLSPGASKPVEQGTKLTQCELDLCGQWGFRIDPDRTGDNAGWAAGTEGASGWKPVTVPHTWQIEPEFVEYRGAAWYQRHFDVSREWMSGTVRAEFEAVFHSATVWVNGKQAGSHLRKGYTAFTFDITRFLKAGEPNTIVVRVDNAFDEHMLPRGRSSDWAHDGGIYRPVRLIVTPKTFAERVDVDTKPDFSSSEAALETAIYIHNSDTRPTKGSISLVVIDDGTEQVVHSEENAGSFTVAANSTARFALSSKLQNAKFWHFDHPHLYRMDVRIQTTEDSHLFTTSFGIRKLEVRQGAFYFNNEKVFLMGVERMAGSNPEFGMAEPTEWIEHDHRDLKNLNCMFTRVHWPQDKRVLDFCDRHGILLQSEVPTWGPNTFKGMEKEPDTDIMENGFEQLHEMVARDRNHPCIVSWGLCNEINGQNPPAYNFAKNMLAEAKKIDPSRLCSYASHSLFHTQAQDVSGLMDFVECNQYIGSWQTGGPPEVDRLLEEIHTAFPDKAIVISEYGYCACTADRPEGDGHRAIVLKTQDEVFRRKPYVGGAIFFCYNDYRTHVGDRGEGVMKQRVHGVVDLYGRQKESYELLRYDSSPIEAVTISNFPKAVTFHLRTRQTLPSYTLKGYKARGIYFGPGDIPVERKEIALTDLQPGAEASIEMPFGNSEPIRIVLDILRPTGFSAWTTEWKR